MVGASALLFVEADYAPVLRRFDDAEFAGHFLLHRNGGDGHLRALLHVKLEHLANIHAVNVIGAEDDHQVRIGLFDQVDVLINGVGRAAIPILVRASAFAPEPE